ncbi:uncharacterized protein ASCRUDRAFT_73552 [Ascoidea rubescens DSM 1968]|uniref:DnaJ homologue subfamily C member 28 conserved domain-containing protein n=1 Tax=Ascoidea rubescens DSM 1968 TaxID=1344418 RepID=A0A1D2VQC8_9ASCO|nr:hypothetical protein ASCRUDRAFT_73552 [Ascoidea rubescens DSM 1968]ODV63767.1 hypothetical protein ASCRUDRAFT_73552 [Ascoidea rubescens DSM 1968]
MGVRSQSLWGSSSACPFVLTSFLTRSFVTSLSKKTSDEGYMKRRLEQLAEESFLENSKFFKKHEKQIYISEKIPKNIDKFSKDNALSAPWTGEESVHDANLRMLVDSHKPLKQKISGNGLLKMPIAKRKSVSDRFSEAREKSLDYSLSKISETKSPQEEEDDGFKEMYRERLLGPELLGPTSFASTISAISSLADERIEEARKRGEFDNLPNRGKPMASNPHQSNPHLDRTEYHMNNILIKQDIVPPWIEKQTSVDLQIKHFRQGLQKKWRSRAINLVIENNKNSNNQQKLQIMQSFADNEINKTGPLLRDPAWENSQKSSLTPTLRSLNDIIRGYNLMAPMPSQKFYLLEDRELERCYKETAPHLVDALKRHLMGASSSTPQIKINPATYIPQSTNTSSVSSLFWKMFSK